MPQTLANIVFKAIEEAINNIRLPADKIINQLPGRVIPPGGPSGDGYPPAPHDTAWADVTGAPTTLAGYGITDAASDTELAAHEADTTSVHGIADTSTLYRSGGTDVSLADGGTGASLTDPNADRILFWDDSAGSMAFLTASTGLTITGTNLTASGGGSIDVTDGTTTVSPTSTLVFPAGTITDNGSGEAEYTPAGGGGSLTVEEVDGSPTDSAVTKIVFPNGTLGIVSHVATYTPAGGGGSDAVTTGTVAAIIGGLAGSPDVNGVAGGGTSREFESGDTAPTWSSAPNATDVGTTAASHLYVRNNSGTELRGLYAWAPGSGAFDARCKVAGIATDAIGGGGAFGLLITSSGDSDRLLLEFEFQNGGQWSLNGYSYTGGGYTGRTSSYSLTGAQSAYLRITRDGSNNCSFWVSDNGLAWQHLITFSFTLTIANIGFRSTGDATGITHAYVDWLRTSV